MSSLREVLKYVRAVREELNLPFQGGNLFRGCAKHPHPPTEQLVKRAPDRIGHLSALWWDMHMRLEGPDRGGEERARLIELSVEVNSMIDTEVKWETRGKPNEGLQLRSNGTFVRVIAERFWPAATTGLPPL